MSTMMMNGVASSGSGVGGAGNIFQMKLLGYLSDGIHNVKSGNAVYTCFGIHSKGRDANN